MDELRKYPRTPHLAGSRLQPGDADLLRVPTASLVGRRIVVEEKLDGANAAISFTAGGRLRLQSRGHFLNGGPRERQFQLFKAWAAAHQASLFAVLGSRYVLYGEWLYAKHTMFYDALPHYFLAFDVLDTRANDFLATPIRHALLHGTPVISAPLLWSGRLANPACLLTSLGTSSCKTSSWRNRLSQSCERLGQDLAAVLRETDASDLMEGLYIKVEEDDRVLGRCKFVRESFSATVGQSGSHWLERPILPNALRDGVDLFAAVTAP